MVHGSTASVQGVDYRLDGLAHTGLKWSTLADAIWSQTGLRELEHTLLRENVQCTPPSSRRDIEVLRVVK